MPLRHGRLKVDVAPRTAHPNPDPNPTPNPSPNPNPNSNANPDPNPDQVGVRPPPIELDYYEPRGKRSGSRTRLRLISGT